MDHRDLRELAAGAALGGLDPVEQLALADHLPTCSECLRLSAELGDVLGDLALTAPEVRPPATLLPELRAALQASTTQQLVAAGATLGASSARAAAGAAWSPARPVVRSVRPVARHAALAGLAAAAAFAMVAVGLGLRGQTLEAQLIAARQQQAQEQAVLSTMANPDRRTAALEAPTGPAATVVWVPGTDEAWLLAEGLPATPDGWVYQLWHANATGVHPLGTFTHDGGGTIVARFGVDLDGSVAAMVTLEPVGGAQGTPGPEVVFGELGSES